MRKEEIIEYMEESTYKPLTAEELIEELDIKDVPKFLEFLNEMEKEGQIICTRKNKYGIPERMGLLVGSLQFHPKGYGFIIPERRPKRYQGGDVYVSPSNINGAMHSDRVIVRFSGGLNSHDKPEGEIIRIIERRNETIVGTLERSRNFGFVLPDDHRIGQDIFIPFEQLSDAKDGDKVVVKITKWPVSRRNPEGKIIEILGTKGDKGIDVLSIIRKFRLPEEFPKKVLKETEKLSYSLTDEELKKRKDLRDLSMVTIDGADAKDLDDAVSITRMDNGNYKLGVHIADVGFYVQEGSTLDEDAFERGTSVYLVDRVVPMLPTKLSNDICSLNAGVDRLAMSVFMEVDHQGKVKDFEITPSVINVDKRMTYDMVNEILANNSDLKKEHADFLDDFYYMRELCGILNRKRLKRGAIDFEFPESKVVLDKEGRPLDIVKVERGNAERMIEEFMILANETVAEYMHWRKIPFIYRVHEGPGADDLEGLNSFLGAFGFHLRLTDGEIHPAGLQEIIEESKGRPEEKLINTVILRSMKHAHYSNEPIGHFGLSSEFYSHFTSPIRRYPDLVIHRIIRESLAKGTLSDKRLEKLQQLTARSSENSSARERVAEEAERESVDMKKIEYMERYLGETFEGIIAGVTGFGFFVELENTVEGLVHVSTLTDDFYHYDNVSLSLRGEHTGKTFKIGQIVTVQIAKVDVEKKELDLELVKAV